MHKAPQETYRKAHSMTKSFSFLIFLFLLLNFFFKLENNEKMCFLVTSQYYQLNNLTFIVALQVLWNAFQPRG